MYLQSIYREYNSIYNWYLEDLAPGLGGQWLITMVSTVNPLRIGLWDPFQMAFYG